MIITISNHKGGVGKTTSTINIGAGLARRKYKVLLIDLDPQANMSISLGVQEPKVSMYHFLKGTAALQPTVINEYLELLPATLELSAAELELNAEPGREYVLKDALAPIASPYDYILIDSPPALGLLTINTLVASEQVLMPVQAHYLSVQGLKKLVEVIEKLQRRINPELRLRGLFLTQYDQRKILHRDVSEKCVEFFGDKVLDTKIRDNIALAEAPTARTDIFNYQPESAGAKDYAALCDELLKG